MTQLLDYRDHVGTDPGKFYKTTLCESPRLLLGLNCLEPGQTQAPHAHDGEDKFYLVLEGRAQFELGLETHSAEVGQLVWAPAGLSHGVTNPGADRLVLLMGMAPAP